MALVPAGASVAVAVLCVALYLALLIAVDVLARRRSARFVADAAKLTLRWWQFGLRTLSVITAGTAIVTSLAFYKAAIDGSTSAVRYVAISAAVAYCLVLPVWWYQLVTNFNLKQAFYFSAFLATFCTVFAACIGGLSPVWGGLMAIPLVFDLYRVGHHAILWQENKVAGVDYMPAGVVENNEEVFEG